MSILNISKILKKEFKKGFYEFIDTMGQKVEVFIPPHSVTCPNCLWDSVQNSSINVFNNEFKRPLIVFPNTIYAKTIYPVPFNIDIDTDIQYNPQLIDPKILQCNICPVCNGEGKITSDNSICIQCLVTWDYSQTGGETTKYLDLSAGRDGKQIVRLKTYDYNYAICRDALYFIINGIKCEVVIPPKLKGLGDKHITEVFLVTVAVDASSEIMYDTDTRLSLNSLGTHSNQASSGTPTIPPNLPGDDVW